MRGKHVLSIDQGTTGTSVLIFDSEGEVRSRAYSEFTQYYPRPGWVEHDASEIWQVSIGVIAEALKAGDIRASDVDAIGITNQRETVVLWGTRLRQAGREGDCLAGSPHGGLL
jgi:glycerol kinase